MKNRRPTIHSKDEDAEGGKLSSFESHLHVLHKKAIFVMLGFTFIQFFFMGYIVEAGELTIKALLNCTNKIRVAHAEPAQTNELVTNKKLTVAAEDKLKDMAQYKYWAHQNPITGKQPWNFVDDAGYYYETSGENLAYGFSDSQKICDAWEKSPKHLANIMDSTYEEVGFAVDKANLHKNEKEILVVQMFGSRKDFVPGQEESGDSETQQKSTVVETKNCLTNTEQCAQNLTPEVNGASTQKEESVYPHSSGTKTFALYGSIVAAILAAFASIGIFKFKKQKNKVKMYQMIALIGGIIAVVLFLLFFFIPAV